MRPLLPFAIVCCCLAITTVSTNVHAQADSSSDDEVARELFEAGELSVDRGDYERALDLFQESFELSDRPELLFNAANAAERLRRDTLAIELYTSYLERIPDAANRETVEARLERLRRAVAEAAEESSDDQATTEESSGRIWTWIAGSSAVALTALGVAARFRANAVFSDLEDECGNAPGCSDERLNGSSLQAWDRTTVISFSIAGAAAVGFVIALLLEGGEDEDQAVSVSVGPNGLYVGGTF